MVGLRRGRLLNHESRRRRALFARQPYRFCFCHFSSAGLLVLVRQLHGPHLSRNGIFLPLVFNPFCEISYS